MTTNDMKMKSNHEMSCRPCIKHTSDNGHIRYRTHTGTQKLYKSNCFMRISEWRNEIIHGWISEWTVIYIPGTMVSVCVFSHVLKMDDALIGAMSCVSKILSSFVYAFSTTKWQIYLGTQPCISNTLSTRCLRAQIYTPIFF